MADVINPEKAKRLRHRIARDYRTLNAKLGLGIEHAKPEQFVSRIVSDLKLSAEAERIARQLLREHPVPNGSSPLLWCAACVYESSKRTGETRGQREFKVYGSEVTLRKNWNRLPHESKPKPPRPKHNNAYYRALREARDKLQEARR